MTTDEAILPRELADGVHWLGRCLHLHRADATLHAYNSSYLVSGDACSILVEAGHPQDAALIEHQIDALLQSGAPPLRYVFVSHTETPHAAAVGRLLARYPEAIACGDVEDLHLVFPHVAERLRPLDPGDTIDLGGSQFVVVEAVFRDMLRTRWGFDTRRGVLFSGDGFSYSHYHEAGQCGKVAEEAPSLAIDDMAALFAELAFSWTRLTDIEPYIARLEELIFDELPVKLIAPTHGLPITDPGTTLPEVVRGLRIGSTSRGSAIT